MPLTKKDVRYDYIHSVDKTSLNSKLRYRIRKGWKLFSRGSGRNEVHKPFFWALVMKCL